jgi:hypothetical protein
LYFSVIILEWALVGIVWFGLGRREQVLGALLGGKWNSGRAILLDVVSESSRTS